MKLLIVDDEDEIREGLAELIDWNSVSISMVLSAKGWMEAIKIAKKEVPDILLSDIKMPGMDGLELCELIKSINPRVKIILLSGYSDFSYARRAISIGVKEYFLKPVNIELLLQKTSELVKEVLCEQTLASLNNHEIRGKRDQFLTKVFHTPKGWSAGG